MNKLTGKASDLVLFLMGQEKDKLWDLSEHKQKRSLSQNAYYWTLAGKVAQKTGVSSAEIHNRNLRDLGLVLRIDEKIVPVYLPDTDESERTVLKADTYHLKPTSNVKEGKDGQLHRCYVMLRGSSTFNVQEMTALLDLMIQEAKALDIEVLSDTELAHIRELERIAEQNKSRRNNPQNKGDSGKAG